MKVLITGAAGMLARAVRDEFERRGHAVVAAPRSALDVLDADAVRAMLRREAPHAVVQCAAYTRVDDAERDERAAWEVNALGTRNVARACAEAGARFLYPSTDYVFDGASAAAYPVDAPPRPLNAYGRTKLAGEAEAAAVGSLVVRTSWLYGPGGRSFVGAILDRARRGEELRVVDDQRGSPTWTRDLAAVLAELLERSAPAGVYHAAGEGATTWYGFAREILRIAGISARLTPVTSAEFGRPAARPENSLLDCSRTVAITGPIPHWRDALETALREGL